MKKTVSCLELFAGILICALSVATPWLYGTTEDWSVRLMNCGCLALAIIVAVSWILAFFAPAEPIVTPPSRFSTIATTSFFLLNLLLLAYCAVAYFNPRATFSIQNQDFTYFEHYNARLPTTYDRELTGETLLNLLSLFAFFWCVRYWLLRGWQNALNRGRKNPMIFHNRRFRILCWVLTLNAILLSVQATLQRLTKSQKLLWLRDSWWKSPEACFGPFSYRGNAAEYFNLLWPLAFGFALLLLKNRDRTIHRGRAVDGPELLLIPGLIILGAAPFLSLSRGGAIAAAFGLGLFAWAIISDFSHSTKAKISAVLIFAGLFLAVWLSASHDLLLRFEIEKGDLSGRAEIYENAKAIAKDYPLFGTGPGTFRSVYYLYRPNLSQPWHAFLHDDWMETRVCFGWVGFVLALLNLGMLVLWIFSPGRAPTPRLMFCCLLIALGQTLLKAKFDFPFQTYSIFLTFILVSAITVSGSCQKC
jgi:O-antigen ligase